MKKSLRVVLQNRMTRQSQLRLFRYTRKDTKCMLDLNSEEIKKLDPVDTISITGGLLEQCQAAWEQVNNLDIPKLENISTVVFCGMGASIYGALVLKSILGTE